MNLYPYGTGEERVVDVGVEGQYTPVEDPWLHICGRKKQ